MHTRDKFSITDSGNRSHLATKNICTFSSVASNSDFFFTVERYCDLPVLLIQSIGRY